MQKLFGISITLSRDTPNLDAMVRVGEYFANGGSGELAGSTDPIVLSCQKNWHMLFTDGITNQPKVPTKDVQNQDKTVPALPEAVISIPALVPGQPWPPLYIEGSAAATNNSAADYATYYWVTDLRTSGATAKNNVPGGDSDPATWQHLNFAALSLGTEGKLAAGNQSDTEKQTRRRLARVVAAVPDRQQARRVRRRRPLARRDQRPRPLRQRAVGGGTARRHGRHPGRHREPARHARRRRT